MAVYIQLVGTGGGSPSCALVRFSGAPVEDGGRDGDSRTSGLIADTVPCHPVVVINLTSREVVVDCAPHSFRQFNWMAHGDDDVRSSVYKRGKVGDTYVVDAAPPATSWRQRMEELPNIRRIVCAHFLQSSQPPPLMMVLVSHPPVAELRDLLQEAAWPIGADFGRERVLEVYVCLRDAAIPTEKEAVYEGFERSLVWPQVEFDSERAASLAEMDPLYGLTPGLQSVRAFIRSTAPITTTETALAIRNFETMHFFETAPNTRTAAQVFKYLFGEVRKSEASAMQRLSVPLPSSGWGSRLRLFAEDSDRKWLNAQHQALNCASPAIGSTTFNVTVLDRHKAWSVLLLLELSDATPAQIVPTPTLITCRDVPLSTGDDLGPFQHETETIERINQVDRDAFVTALVRTDRQVDEFKRWVGSWSLSDAFGVPSLYAFMHSAACNLLNVQATTIDSTLRMLELKRPRDLSDGGREQYVVPRRRPLPCLPTRAVSQVSRS